MSRINRNISVNAPVERVFDFVADPKNLPEIWPGMIEVKDVKKATSGGFDFNWAYKMSGMRFEGKSQTVEFVKGQRLTVKSTKGIEGTLTWRCQPDDGHTRLSYEYDYRIPQPLLNKLNEPIVIRETEHEVDALLENVRTRLELGSSFS